VSTISEEESIIFAKSIAGDRFNDAWDSLSEIDEALAITLRDYVFGTVFKNCKLSIAEMELCIIASLTVQSHVDQLPFHFKVALKHGVTANEMLAIIIHCMTFSGWPKGINAIKKFKQWLIDDNVSFEKKSQEDIYDSKTPDFNALGKREGSKIYADYNALENAVSSYEEGLENYITEGIFGRFYGRNDIDIKSRQLSAVAILTSLQRLPQLESHIKGALAVDCSSEEIMEVIKLMHVYAGWPATLNALNVWKSLVEK